MFLRMLSILVLLCAVCGAQVAQRSQESPGGGPPPTKASPAPVVERHDGESSSLDSKVDPAPLVRQPDVKRPRATFDWQAAANQSFFFLSIEHGFRMTQGKTRAELGGRFWEEYRNAVSGLGGWGDGDSIFTNYVGHPMQGAITGFIQIQNDPSGVRQEFAWSPEYWKSRSKAMAWAALYSTQFELGPVSEASLGHVGKKRGTMGFVDLVMTPVGGMGLIVAEDAIDKKWIERLEGNAPGRLGKRRFYRMVLNPQRTFANLLRFKKPWHRDTRNIDWDPADSPAPAPRPAAPSSAASEVAAPSPE